MIHLDTHVAVWIATGEHGRMSATARETIEREAVALSPVVLLEMQLLSDIGRVNAIPETMLAYLRQTLGAAVTETSFEAVARAAQPLAWTRDPFDRLIVGAAIADGARLITADRKILQNFPAAVW